MITVLKTIQPFTEKNCNNHRRKALPRGLPFHLLCDGGGDAMKPKCSLGRAGRQIIQETLTVLRAKINKVHKASELRDGRRRHSLPFSMNKQWPSDPSCQSPSLSLYSTQGIQCDYHLSQEKRGLNSVVCLIESLGNFQKGKII